MDFNKKRFLRIYKKYPVSLKFFKSISTTNTLKFLKYAVSLHVILKRKLIISSANRVFIKYNALRKNLFSYKKRNQKRKHLLPWTERVVQYFKKNDKLVKFRLLNAIADYNSDSTIDENTETHPDEIQAQLKAQLKLLNNNKRSVSLLGDVSQQLIPKSSNLSELSKKIFERNVSFGSISNNSMSPKKLNDENSLSNIQDDLMNVEKVGQNPLNYEGKLMTSVNNLETDISIISEPSTSKKSKENESINSKKSFIDSLMNKVCSSSKNEILNEIDLEKTNNSKKSVDVEYDSDTGDFFRGFSASDIENHPSLLPTPIVPRRSTQKNAAFVSSEDFDSFVKGNCLEASKIKLAGSKKMEEGLISKNSVPPKLAKPAREINLIRPRTVAEKRLILQKGRNYKYLMIENENSIYRELKRRSKGSRPVNLQLVRHIQDFKVPFSRDLWKAMSWLCTENNNYYFQNIVIDGVEAKLICGRGNYKNKYLSKTTSFLKQEDKCTALCLDKQNMSFMRIRYKPKPKVNNESKLMGIKKLKTTNSLRKMRKLPTFTPGPLSSKCLQMKKYFEPSYGTPELYTLPEIQLEVFPKINYPLDEYIKGYLKLVLPSKNITKEWAEFAVSTLIANQNEDKQALQSYTFTIPYQNNEKNIIVRHLLNRNEIYDDSFELKFRKNIDINNKLELECADILSGMIESVAISLGEDSFIKEDIDVDSKDKDNEKEVLISEKTTENKHKLISNENDEPPIKKSKKSNPKARLLLELRRLNATIIDAEASPGKKIKKLCGNDYCRLGCICNSLINPTVIRNHCQKEECIFECSCIISTIDKEISEITSSDAFALRRKATARLARMEREFTSTVVLTNNETVLINESQLERKRRCTQRFLNYSQDNSDDEKPKQSNRKKRVVSTNTKSPIKEAKIPIFEDITYVSEDIYKMLKHCSLNILNLELKNFHKWCMVHCLYNCYCKGRDTEGKPFVLKKENFPPEQQIVVSRKPRYSFEKHEKHVIETETISEKKLNNNLESTKMKTNVIEIKNIEKKNCASKLTEEKTEEKKNPILDNEKNTENVNRHKKRKKLKSLVINEMAEKLETIKIRNPNEINESTIKIRNPNEINECTIKIRNPTEINESLNDSEKLSNYCQDSLEKENIILNKYTNQDSDVICRRVIRIPLVYKWRNKRPAHLARRRIFVENLKTDSILNSRIKESELYKTSKSDRPKKPKIMKPEIMKGKKKLTDTKKVNTSNVNNIDDISKSNFDVAPEPKGFLRISSVVSIGAQNLHASTSNKQIQPNQIVIADVNTIPKKNYPIKFNTNLLQTSPTLTIPDNSEGGCKSDRILNALNFAVTKTMHNICQIQLKETKHIPPPVPEQLYICQWRYFLQAFKEGLINVWEVQVENSTYFTATMEFVPLISNAFLVVNIKAVPKEKLQLFGKMLTSHFTNSHFNTLSVLLIGSHDHWRIIGMTKANIDYLSQGGVIKPTPQSHPWLSKKINRLYEFMTNKHKSKLGRKLLERERRMREAATLNEKLRMNITIRKVSQQDIKTENLIIPLTSEKKDHKWLILDLVNDFTHMLFLNTVTWLSVNKIKIGFQRSREENKMVRLPKIDGHSLDCYITKCNENRIYLGPFAMNKEPSIVLFHCVNGKMIIRERYEQQYNKKYLRKTIGFWLCFKDGKVMCDLDFNSKTKDYNNSLENANGTNPSLINAETNANILNYEKYFTDLGDITALCGFVKPKDLSANSIKMDQKRNTESNFKLMEPGNYEIRADTLNKEANIFPTNIFKSGLNDQVNTCNIPNAIKITDLINGQPLIVNSTNNQNYKITVKQNIDEDEVNNVPISQEIKKYFMNPLETKSAACTSSSLEIDSTVNRITEHNNEIDLNLLNYSLSNCDDKGSLSNSSIDKKTEISTKFFGNLSDLSEIKVVNINNFINTNSCAIELPSAAQNNSTVTNICIKQDDPVYNSFKSQGDARDTDKKDNSDNKFVPDAFSQKDVDQSLKRQSSSMYGCFFSDVPGYPKFGGMKLKSHYLIRMNCSSALQLNNLKDVSVFLNRHVMKHNFQHYKPEFIDKQWDFKPFPKSIHSEILPQIILKDKNIKTIEENAAASVNSNKIIIIDDD